MAENVGIVPLSELGTHGPSELFRVEPELCVNAGLVPSGILAMP
jgi:hypothetical protein